LTVPTTSRGWRAFVLAAFLAVLPSAASVIQLKNFDISGIKPSAIGPSPDALLSHAPPAAASNNMIGSDLGAAVAGLGDSISGVVVADNIQYSVNFATRGADVSRDAIEIPLFHPEYFTILPFNRGRKEIEIKENRDVTIAYARLWLEGLLESIPPAATLALATVATGFAIFLVGPAFRRARAKR